MVIWSQGNSVRKWELLEHVRILVEIIQWHMRECWYKNLELERGKWLEQWQNWFPNPVTHWLTVSSEDCLRILGPIQREAELVGVWGPFSHQSGTSALFIFYLGFMLKLSFEEASLGSVNFKNHGTTLGYLPRSNFFFCQIYLWLLWRCSKANQLKAVLPALFPVCYGLANSGGDLRVWQRAFNGLWDIYKAVIILGGPRSQGC